jgi:glutaredoxin-like protein
VALISDDLAAQIKEELQGLANPVRLAVFSQALADPEAERVKHLVEELGTLEARLGVVSYNFVLDKDKAADLGIARIPAIAILGAEKDYGIRFYGAPTGYEFGLLIDTILEVSRGESGLSEPTRAALAELPRPVHLQVFSTPTCPYCPRAALLAFRFALASDKVSADAVEVTGFPELARRYQVSSVPKTVVGDTLEFVGALPEAHLLQQVQQASGAGTHLIA